MNEPSIASHAAFEAQIELLTHKLYEAEQRAHALEVELATLWNQRDPVTVPTSDEVKQLRAKLLDTRERFIFQGGSLYAERMANALSAPLPRAVSLQLPDGDPRTASILFQEDAPGASRLYIQVSEGPAMQAVADATGASPAITSFRQRVIADLHRNRVIEGK